MKRLVAVLMVALVPALTLAQADDAAVSRQDLQDIEKRLEKVERASAQDRIRFTGDYRFEAHSITASIPDHFDGMKVQNGLVNTLFYYGATGSLPQSMAAVNQFVAQHYGDYLYFTNNLVRPARAGDGDVPAGDAAAALRDAAAGRLLAGLRRRQLSHVHEPLAALDAGRSG